MIFIHLANGLLPIATAKHIVILCNITGRQVPCEALVKTVDAGFLRRFWCEYFS